MKRQLWSTVKRSLASSTMMGLFLCGQAVILHQTASSQVVTSAQNARQIALLHWYQANQTALFPVSGDDLAFDGANMWVRSAGNIVKLRASDGAMLGVFSVGGDSGILRPQIAFDGENIWVLDSECGCTDHCFCSSSSATKLRASDGKNVGVFPFNNNRFLCSLAFDGANMWVVSRDPDTWGAATVTKLRASDGMNLGTFPIAFAPRNIAFDGANIWITFPAFGTVSKFDANGNNLGTFTVGANPDDLAFDGTNMWVLNQDDLSLTRLRASDGACVGVCTFSLPNAYPFGLAFDGANLWVAATLGPVTEVRASDGVIIGQFGGPATHLAFDGANIWAINNESQGPRAGMLSKY